MTKVNNECYPREFAMAWPLHFERKSEVNNKQEKISKALADWRIAQ